jgi:hypothetical protein
MKRSGFKPKTAPRPAKVIEYEPRPRAKAVAVADHRARLVVPLPKRAPWRSEQYRRLVAALPCAHCGRPGPSQAAHADEGKGLGIKASDETCFPLCADAPGWRGCHSVIGSSGQFTREQRRELEARYGQQTRILLADSLPPGKQM